jgi:hypothetical protein
VHQHWRLKAGKAPGVPIPRGIEGVQVRQGLPVLADVLGATVKISRRKLLSVAAGPAVFPTLSRIAKAQVIYPTRPITMIVPIAPGGATDAVARIIAEGMRQSLRQSIVIENAPGADGNIGTGRAARARPDGYTIGYGIWGTHAFNGAFYSLPYDVLNDFGNGNCSMFHSFRLTNRARNLSIFLEHDL